MLLVLLGTGMGLRSRPLYADESLELALAAARKQLVAGLEAVAEWCNTNRVQRERDAAYGVILSLVPEHARARAALRYTRDPKTQAWRQIDYVQPRNRSVGHVPEARRRRREVQEPYRDAVLQAVEVEGEALSVRRREELLERLLDAMPEDEILRRKLGHIKHEDRWLLPESVAGLRRRQELREGRVRGDELSRERSKPSLLGMTPGARVRDLAAWATTDQWEGGAAVNMMQQAELMGRLALGRAPEDRLQLRALLMGSLAEARAFLARDPSVGTALLASMKDVSSVWTPGGLLVCYASGSEQRDSAVMRQAGALVLNSLHQGDRPRGWIVEGIGQRLCWHGFGRHGLSRFAFERAEAQGGDDVTGRARLPPVAVSWLAAAGAVLEEDPVPIVATLLTRPLDAMDVRDVLAAYALGAYLLEGRPDALASLVEASTSLDDSGAQVRQALGVDLATLAWRVRRWVREAEGA
jgi:hypothetical protein